MVHVYAVSDILASAALFIIGIEFGEIYQLSWLMAQPYTVMHDILEVQSISIMNVNDKTEPIESMKWSTKRA